LPGSWPNELIHCQQFGFYNLRQRQPDFDDYRSGIAFGRPFKFTGKRGAMNSINRRSFLILAPVIAFAGALSGCLYQKFQTYEAQSGGDELAQIVDEYLKNFPQERDVRFLCERLGLELDTSADKAFLSEPTILVRIEQDFAEGQTVSVAGWILSKTEVRVLALSSLLDR
jgi:hypothetical protein